MTSNTVLHVRGVGSFEGTLLEVGATTTRYKHEGKTHEVPTWKVAHIAWSDVPASLHKGQELLSEGAFAPAIKEFEALGASGHAAASWGWFHAANARRIQAGVAERGHAEAVAAYRRYLNKHPHTYHSAPARLGLALSTLAHGGDQAQLTQALGDFSKQKVGPVWSLWSDLVAARAYTAARKKTDALDTLKKVYQRANRTKLCREPAQMAQALRVETLTRLGAHSAAMRAVPTVKAIGTRAKPRLAIYGEEWLASPATPVLLNAIGQALIARAPDVVGATAAVPFHLRVVRYHASQHIEHARALRHLVNCFQVAKQKLYQVEFEGILRDRYPEAPTQPVKTGAPLPGKLGDK